MKYKSDFKYQCRLHVKYCMINSRQFWYFAYSTFFEVFISRNKKNYFINQQQTKIYIFKMIKHWIYLVLNIFFQNIRLSSLWGDLFKQRCWNFIIFSVAFFTFFPVDSSEFFKVIFNLNCVYFKQNLCLKLISWF